MKSALVVGCQGQDGRILSSLLLEKGYCVRGIDLDCFFSSDSSTFPVVDIQNPGEVESFLEMCRPDEIYYLPAFHHSSQDGQPQNVGLLWRMSYEVHVQGLLNFLEAVDRKFPSCRVFYASSSLVFGRPDEIPQTETTPLVPRCIYGITKEMGMRCCEYFREERGLFVSVGILFNHESRLRGPQFLSQKIVTTARRIKDGSKEQLVVGDLDAETDWGYAPDFVEAMWLLLQAPQPVTCIIATGTLHTVRNWVEIAFRILGLDWRPWVREDKGLLTRKKGKLLGNFSHLHNLTGWTPRTSFEKMVELMIPSVCER